MPRVVGVALACALCTATARAQVAGGVVTAPMTGDPTRDSASVARDAWRAAARATSLTEALPLVRRATTAWPMQPTYWLGLVRVAAQAGDTTQVRAAVRALDAMDLAPALFTDARIERALTTLLDTATVAALRAHAAPVATGHVLATVADTGFFAEGVDAHTASGTVYVASIHRRTIVAWHNGAIRDLALARDPRIGAVFGVRVAPDGRTLWCTTASHPNMQHTGADSVVVPALVHVRVADGAVLDVIALPSGAPSRLPGDLTLVPDGSVLVSDSDGGALLHWHPTTRTWEAITDPRFRSLQGMAIAPDQRTAVIADWSHGLFRVDLRTRDVIRIADRANTTVLGIDGLTWHAGGVIGVQNGVEPARIVHVTFDAALRTVTAFTVLDRQAHLAPEPTIGTRLGNAYVYVANSQWNAYDANGQRRAGTSLAPTRLVCVPLPTTGSAAARSGKRSTASTPPSARSCSASTAPSP